MNFRALALGVCIAAFSGSAYGQQPVDKPSSIPPCTKTPSESDLDAAKGLHQAAKQYFAKGEYDRAIQSWTDAYNFDCTKFQVFLNIGNAYEKLPGGTEKAIEAFETYIGRAGKDAEPEIIDKVKNLKKLLAASKQPPPPPPPPPGGNGTGHDININDHPDQPATTGGPGPWPWVLTGVGGGIAVVGAVLLGVGAGKISSAEKVCPNRDCNQAPFGTSQADKDAAANDGNGGLTLEKAGGAVLGVGVAAAAGGVIWYLVAPKPQPVAAPTTTPAAPPKPATTLKLDPLVAPGLWGMSARLTW